MHCPHCRQRPIGLFGWLAHQSFQPLWRTERYTLTCRRCGAQLHAGSGERGKRIFLPLLGVGAGIGLGNIFGGTFVGSALLIMAGVAGTVSLHYAMARYELPAGQDRRQLPPARALSKSHSTGDGAEK